MRISDWSSDVCSSDLLRGLDQRAADEQEGEQRGEDRADLLDQRQEPALVPEGRLGILDLDEGALADRDHVAARGVEADRALQQILDIGDVGLDQRLRSLIERNQNGNASSREKGV